MILKDISRVIRNCRVGSVQ